MVDNNIEDILEQTAAFASQHAGDDCDRLVFNASKYPGVDMALAVDTILGRERISRKVRQFASVDGLLYPGRLCVEQCSSDSCACYKAFLVSDLLKQDSVSGIGRNDMVNASKTGTFRPAGSVVDITGGLGVDAYYMSFAVPRVCCFERNTLLALCVRRNFRMLGRGNIEVRNETVSGDNMESLLAGTAPLLVYADPARRGKTGGRVFAIRDYEPDITSMTELVFAHCRYFLVKISPMEDIDAIFNALPQCREIHAVSSGGECKELLLVLDREFSGADVGTRKRVAVSLYSKPEGMAASCRSVCLAGNRKEIRDEYIGNGCFAARFGFTKDEESAAASSFVKSADEVKEGMSLVVPSPAILKTGAYNLFAARSGLKKMDVSTHLYLRNGLPSSPAAAKENPAGAGVDEDEAGTAAGTGMPDGYGLMKAYRILEVYLLDKKGLAALSARIQGRADVTSKNIPLSSDELSRRLKIKSGGSAHVWGCRAAGKNILLLTEKKF